MTGPDASLTTHVLDIAAGRPAAGLRVVLRRLSDGATLADIRTDADGRADRPLLTEAEPGDYELSFHLGEYFGDASFLDVAPVRFRIAEGGGHYHVPLLAAPYGYSTYRGS